MRNNKHLNKIVDQAVEASFQKGKLDETVVRRFVKEFKNMHLAEGIYCLSRYAKGLKRVILQQTMLIESVIPLSLPQVNHIKSKLNRLFTISDTRVTINPYILGGIKVKVGDTVFDYSIRNKIEQLKETIING